MRPAALRLLRQLAVAALAAALLLLAGPPLARELGLAGPSLAEEIAVARSAIAVAREYGASESVSAYAEALGALERAELHAGAGQRRRALRAAREARSLAIEAQRLTLAAREEARRRARVVVLEVDERIDELEALHASIRGLDAAERSSLTTLMKQARREGAGLSVAFEEGEFERVLEQRHRVLETLESARATLSRVRDTRPGSGG